MGYKKKIYKVGKGVWRENMKEVKEIESKYDHISLHICIKFARVKINSFKVPIFVSLTLCSDSLHFPLLVPTLIVCLSI